MSCDFGEHVVVCTITDESLAASFKMSMDDPMLRVAKRTLRERNRIKREERRLERVELAFEKALRDAKIQGVKGCESLRACAKRFGLSYERIRQIQKLSRRGPHPPTTATP